MFIVCIILNKVANAFSNKHTNIPVLSVLDSRIPRFPDSPIPGFPIPCIKDSHWNSFQINIKFNFYSNFFWHSNVALFLGVGRSNCDTISLGQGQGPIATKMIAKVIIILKIIISLYIYKQFWLTLFTSLLTNSQL